MDVAYLNSNVSPVLIEALAHLSLHPRPPTASASGNAINYLAQYLLSHEQNRQAVAEDVRIRQARSKLHEAWLNARALEREAEAKRIAEEQQKLHAEKLRLQHEKEEEERRRVVQETEEAEEGNSRTSDDVEGIEEEPEEGVEVRPEDETIREEST